MKVNIFLCGVIFFLVACGTPTSSADLKTVNVYAASSSQFWLADLYNCADDLSVVLKIDAREPDIYLRLGEPERIISPAYKIGEEEILIAANNAVPIQNLSLTEAREIFAQENPSMQVWVFSAGEDMQTAFDQLVMQGRRVASSARVATSVEQMSVRVGTESGAVGILPKHWMNESVHAVFSAGVVPVLAITKQEPQGAVAGLISCLQGK
jgi:F0F1-type ATP synthase epsilon subunit